MPTTTAAPGPPPGLSLVREDAPSEQAAPTPQPRVDLSATLRHMHGRSEYRKYHGAYAPARPALSAMLILLLVVTCMLTAVAWQDGGLVFVLTVQPAAWMGAAAGGAAVLQVLLLLVVLAFLSLKVGALESRALNVLTALFAVASTITAVLVVVNPAGSDQEREGQVRPSVVQDALVTAYLAAALALVAARGAVRSLAPRLAAAGHPLVAPRLLRQEQAAGAAVYFAPGVFAPPAGYEVTRPVVAVAMRLAAPGWLARWAPAWLCRRITYQCSFVGEVDEAGRPHGYCEWRDSSWHGEHLRGWWAEGKPVGPFRSRETGSASGFVCLHFAITSNVRHWWTAALPLPQVMRGILRKAHVQPGSVALEVSTSGAFFQGLPRVSQLEVAGEQWRRAPACGCHGGRRRKRRRGGGGVHDVDDGGADGDVERGGGDGAPPLPRRLTALELRRPVLLPEAPTLDSVGAAPEGAPPPEVFMFIHGLGEDFGQGHVRMFGQMVALLELPPHISPLLFCWPSGLVVLYHAARYLGAEDPGSWAALVGVLRQLGEQGVARVHIATHSMGARVLLGALPLWEGEVAAGAKLPALASATLLNPDYELQTFVDTTGPQLRRMCPIVTVYGDPADTALFMAEKMNELAERVQGMALLGRAVRAVWGSMLRRRGEAAAAATGGGDGASSVSGGAGGSARGGVEEAAVNGGGGSGPLNGGGGGAEAAWGGAAAGGAALAHPDGAAAVTGADGKAAAVARGASPGGGPPPRGAPPQLAWWASMPRRAGSVRARPSSRDDLSQGMWVRVDAEAGGCVTLAREAEGGGSAHGGGAQAAARRSKHLSLGRRIYSIRAPTGAPPLEVDAVDLTCLAVNVPPHRHSVHALNRDVLWDLRSIIVDGQRAAQRTRRLERIAGNVYSFKTSPAHVHVDLM